MTTDYKALCAELLQSVEESDDYILAVETTVDLVIRARAALAEPVPARPTVMEIIELSAELDGGGEVALVRAALDRWGTPNLAQTRSSLGDGPAVPEGREPAAVAEDPTDAELNETYWTTCHSHKDRTNSSVHIAGLRAVLARWGAPHV